MNVLSLFDGISCGQVALNRAKINYDNYFASEIDNHATKVTTYHFPNTIQIGDISDIKSNYLPKIDLLIGGSPCQGFSFAGKQLNFDDERSKLFFEYVRLKNDYSPNYFFFENVKMSSINENVITKYLGVSPIRLNSSIVSAQSRQRLYWTNILVTELPATKNILLQDILIDDYITDRLKSYCIDANYGKGSNPRSYAMGRRQIVFKNEANLTLFQAKRKETKTKEVEFRILTPEECEILQTLPIGYTNLLSKINRYHCIGNGWTIDIISHLLKNINNSHPQYIKPIRL